MSTIQFASPMSAVATLALADTYTKAKRSIEGGLVTFAYPNGSVTYERTNNEYTTFPVVYEFDVRDDISAVVSMNPAMFTDIKVCGKIVNEMTIFVVIATNKSRDDAEVAMGIIARQLGRATIPFSVKGDICLNEDFLADEDETIFADGIAACIEEVAPVEESAPIDPALEEAYASLEKAEAELNADPTSRSKARKVTLCQKRVMELGGDI